MSRSTLRIATSILMIKDRIQQFYAQEAQLKSGLNAYKRRHGYCVGRPFCMNMVSDDAVSCDECLKANANPTHTKRQSAYGALRAREKLEERKAKAAKKAKPRRRAA